VEKDLRKMCGKMTKGKTKKMTSLGFCVHAYLGGVCVLGLSLERDGRARAAYLSVDMGVEAGFSFFFLARYLSAWLESLRLRAAPAARAARVFLFSNGINRLFLLCFSPYSEAIFYSNHTWLEP